MKFSYYLEQITGVSIYPIISLLLFVIFFTAVTIWAFRMNRKEVARCERLPLDD
jgi:cytochrome c oxidase cbb3-type subunit 3